MSRFTYYTLNGEPCEMDVPAERLDADEWTVPSRMGGIPAFDPDRPVSEQPHHTDFCTEQCARPSEAIGRIHLPPGVPHPYLFCEEHRSWVTRTPPPPRPSPAEFQNAPQT